MLPLFVLASLGTVTQIESFLLEDSTNFVVLIKRGREGLSDQFHLGLIENGKNGKLVEVLN
jgi:hypothetical protein